MALRLGFQSAHSGPVWKGPYLSWANGIAYIDRRMFAIVDHERRDWYLVREAQHHPILLPQPLP